MKQTSEVPFKMKGTPCSRGNLALLKTLWKTRQYRYWISIILISIVVQGLGPWRGLGQRPNLTLLHRSLVRAPGITHPQHQSRGAGSCKGAKAPLPGGAERLVLDHPIGGLATDLG